MKSIAVLGLGAMGQLVFNDLAKTFNGKIFLLGRDVKKLKKISKGKAEVRNADVTNAQSLIKAFKNIDVVIHAVHHEFNLNVMEACLKSGSNYVDLGGLYHYTKKQLRLNDRFKKKGLTAVLGMGAAPGITNVLAKYGSMFLDEIKSIEMKIGTIDNSTYKQTSPLSNTYSLQTILEEFSWRPAVFVNGKTIFINPGSDREPYKFPIPIGVQKPQTTIHSELATLPFTLKSRNVSFKIAFDDGFVGKVTTLRNLGFVSEDKSNSGTVKSVTIEILKSLPKAVINKINQYEIIHVVLKGKKSGSRLGIVLDAHVKGVNETVDKDTADPASIVAQMIANNQITKKGVFPPENIVPIMEFFNELSKRKIYIYKNNKRLI